jgi:hypothetical protein
MNTSLMGLNNNVDNLNNQVNIQWFHLVTSFYKK